MDTGDLDPQARAALEETLAWISQNTDQIPDWEDGSDLGRLSIQAHQRELAGGFELAQARGQLRFSGDGVHGHSISLSEAGQLMQGWQSLVTAVGGAHEGHKKLVGRFPEDVARRTELDLTTSPSPGSVILEFEPAVRGADERYPEGQAEIQGSPVPLAEAAVDTALEVLGLASAADDVVGDAVEELLGALGPRVATAARNLAANSAKYRLDLSLGWEVPGRGRRRVAVTASQAATFATVLSGHSLDIDTDTLTGTLRTISDIRKIDIEIQDPENDDTSVIVPVARNDVDFSQFRTGDVVQIDVEMTTKPRPGQSETRSYKALSVTAYEAKTAEAEDDGD